MATPPEWIEIIALTEENIPRLVKRGQGTVEELTQKFDDSVNNNVIVMFTFVNLERYKARFN